MSLFAEFGVALVSTVAGILGSMLGLGGGVFIVPILSVFFGVQIKTAIAASAVSVIVNSLSGSAVYLRDQLTNLRLGLLMELTTTVGAIVGSLIVVAVATNVLEIVFGLSLLGMAAAMVARAPRSAPLAAGGDPFHLRGTYRDPSLGQEVTYVPRRLPVGMSASAIAGILSGMLGIGGGAVKVPIMNTIMRVPVKAAAATSVFMVGITISASAFVYYGHGLIDPSVAIPAIVGITLGAQVGARVAQRLRSVTLVRMMVAILVYLALTLLFQAFGIHLPGTRG